MRNKEKSRKGEERDQGGCRARLPASRPWYPLRFINFSQRQCQSHGGFPAAGAPGKPRGQGLLSALSYGLVFKFKNESKANRLLFSLFSSSSSRSRRFLMFFPRFSSFLRSAPSAHHRHPCLLFPPPFAPVPFLPRGPPATVRRQHHPPQPPRSTKAQSIKYSKKPARIRAVLLSLSPPTAIRQPSSSPISLF